MTFINPEKLIEQVDIRPGMKVADFGCGSGFYTIASAKRVGGKGEVYAIDIQKEMLRHVASRAETEHLLNVEIIWADLEIPNTTHLKEESIDLVIISNILFQAENKKNVVVEAWRILKPEGRVLVVEWKPTEGTSIAGPPSKHRISPEACKELFLGAGFKFEKELDAGKEHYALVFAKSHSKPQMTNQIQSPNN